VVSTEYLVLYVASAQIIQNKYKMLNLDNRQYHSGNLRILYGGFPTTWVVGKLERQFMTSIANYFVNQYPDKQIHVISPYWDHYVEVFDYLQQYPIDLLVVCSLSDPVYFKPFESLSSEITVIQAGYTLTGQSIDFFAVVCLKKFKNYTIEQLTPTNFKYLFLNYNRKPKTHRIQLIQELERQNLTELGVITLGNSQYTLNENIDEYTNLVGGQDVLGTIPGIPFDIYSLGRLDIWQQSLINIVSETVPVYSDLFLSEKIYKPIIGMRPFIINGDPNIYKWLRRAGFDCFDDLFPVDDLVANRGNAASIIASAVAQYREVDLSELYYKILPRLVNNRDRFFEYSKNELNKLQGDLTC
jgi:hypothetical protein